MTEPWTLGPWVDLGDSGVRSTLIGGDAVPDPEADYGFAYTPIAEVLDDANRNGANARLVVLAPEMARLLSQVISDPNLAGTYLFDMAASLLARARGEA